MKSEKTDTLNPLLSQKEAKIVALNGKSKKIFTLNHLVRQNWENSVTLNRKSNFANLSVQPHPHPTLICHGLHGDILQVPAVAYSFYI